MTRHGVRSWGQFFWTRKMGPLSASGASREIFRPSPCQMGEFSERIQNQHYLVLVMILLLESYADRRMEGFSLFMNEMNGAGQKQGGQLAHRVYARACLPLSRGP